MDTVEGNKSNKSLLQPKPMSELLLELRGTVSLKHSMQTLTDRKQPPSTKALTRTAVKNIKPLTIAEMRSELLALKAPSPKRYAQSNASARKKKWNSSVKVENKTKSRISQGHLKHNPVRKGLTFLPKHVEPVTLETPKFTKPEFKAKKSLLLQAKNTVRISGVCNIPETPVVRNILEKRRMTLANKENFVCQTNNNRKPPITPIISKPRILPYVPDTPLANMSWKSGNDTSFLLREKEVQDIEDKMCGLTQDHNLENIAEVSPPVSTPFKEYRDVQEFFDHSEDTDNSALCHDNTIMSFDNVLKSKENSEENIIFNLCDLLKKASVANKAEPNTELGNLLKVRKQLAHDIEMVEAGIKNLSNIKESQLKSINYVTKLIREKRTHNTVKNVNNVTLAKSKSIPDIHINGSSVNEVSPITSRPCSVIKTKSVSYNIPKRSPCLRKKILYKSMPNVSDTVQSPNKDMGSKAFNMYMEMKMNQQMNFLNTPRVQRGTSTEPDTPGVTSRNLQIQLDKIYQDI